MATTINVRDLITQEANSQGVPPSIALAVAQQESGINQGAIGSKGEIGTFQLMPSSFPGQDIGDVYTNVNLGVGYLAQLFRKFGDWNTALAAYNWGPGNVSSGKSIPSVVWNYVQSVLGIAGTTPSGSQSSPLDFSSPSTGAATASSTSFDPLSFDPSLLAPILLGAAGLLLLWWAWD